MQTRLNNKGETIYPMVTMGEESFATINFMGNSTNGAGKDNKGRYKTHFVKPGTESSSLLEPYGQTGFFSIYWYYGFMKLRNERLAIYWSTKKVDNTDLNPN